MGACLGLPSVSLGWVVRDNARMYDPATQWADDLELRLRRGLVTDLEWQRLEAAGLTDGGEPVVRRDGPLFADVPFVSFDEQGVVSGLEGLDPDLAAAIGDGRYEMLTASAAGQRRGAFGVFVNPAGVTLVGVGVPLHEDPRFVISLRRDSLLELDTSDLNAHDAIRFMAEYLSSMATTWRTLADAGWLDQSTQEHVRAMAP
jgi:hypothetical protein